MELVYKKIGGFGNLLINLTSIDKNCKKLHESVYDHEVSNCIIINGFEKVSHDGVQPEAPIYINIHTIRNVHPKIRNIIEPTCYMKELIYKNMHVLDDVVCGMSIRRGSYGKDSRQYDDDRDKGREHYFCSDSGLKKFMDVIEETDGKVFVSSDSKETIDIIVKRFGDKIRHLNKDKITHIMDQERNPTIEEYHNIFLKFFILSKCPMLYLTAGTPQLIGFSTYAYMAANYGNKPFKLIFN